MSDTSPSPLTPAVFHVLLALADGPLHGYAVMKRAREESGLTMGPGTVYGTLQRLAETGWVAQAEGADEGDRRRQLSFWLTEEGHDALRAEAERITRLARHRGVRAALAKDAS